MNKETEEISHLTRTERTDMVYFRILKDFPLFISVSILSPGNHRKSKLVLVPKSVILAGYGGDEKNLIIPSRI
jgi:hypothetical protein